MAADKYLRLVTTNQFKWEQGIDVFGSAANAGRLVALDATGMLPTGIIPIDPALFINVKAYGAVGDGVTNDLAAITAALAAVPAAGGTVYFPLGTYAVAGSISVTKGIAFIGANPAFTSTGGSRILQLTAAATTFSVSTLAPVSFKDLLIQNTTGGTGIQIIGPAATDTNSTSLIDNCGIIFGAYGIKFVRAQIWVVRKAVIYSTTTAAIHVENSSTVAQDGGDSTIIESTINVTSGVGINWDGSGGLRISNNKILSGLVGIRINPTTGVNSSIIMIENNSIENNGIAISMNTPGTGVVRSIMIVGNHMAGQTVNQVNVDSTQISNLVIVGNLFGGGVASLPNLQIFQITGARISDNYFFGSGVVTAILVGAAAASVVVGNNTYNGITLPVSSTNATCQLKGIDPFTFAQLPATIANGSVVYCSDGTIANPVAGGGTGCVAKRLNGVWVGN